MENYIPKLVAAVGAVFLAVSPAFAWTEAYTLQRDVRNILEGNGTGAVPVFKGDVLLAASCGCGTFSNKPVKRTAPDFTLKDENGDDVTLSQYRGKYVIVQFYMPGCPHCRATIPGLNEAHKKYADKGLVILAINDQPQKLVRKYLKKYKLSINYKMLRDQGWSMTEANYPEVSGVPHFVLVDPQGNIMLSDSGADKLAVVMKMFKEASGQGG